MSLCIGLLTCSGLLEALIVTGGGLFGGTRMLIDRERSLLKAILLSATALLAYPLSLYLLIVLYDGSGLNPTLLLGFIGLVWFVLGVFFRRSALRTGSIPLRFFAGMSIGTGAAWAVVTILVGVLALLS